jgi:hypothetical protein
MTTKIKTAEQYFEDMWLDLSKDLEQFDHFNSSEFNFINDSSQSSSAEDKIFNDKNFSAQTYEQLLELQNTPEPSYQETHSSDFKERIQAIRHFYNKNPITLNASSKSVLKKSSINQLRRVASNLSKKGFVKQANQINNIADNYDYFQDFDNVEEAISFFHNPSLKD